MPPLWSDFLITLNLDSHTHPLISNAIYPLNDTAFFSVTGPDAQKFLQGQLSCDVTKISTSTSGLGSHNSAKGRMLSSFRLLLQKENSYLFAVHASIIDNAEKALAKYIVFSKACIQQEANIAGIGLHGAQAEKNLQELFAELPTEDYAQIQNENGLLICTSKKHQSYELYLEARKAITLWPALSNALTATQASQQKLIQHLQGLAFIEKLSADVHIPQMFNYQKTCAVSFDKGCYTGQEIVARMQYLGKLKRHMYHYQLHAEVEISCGDKLFIEPGSQSIGDVASAVQTAENAWDVLLVLTDKGLDAQSLHNEKGLLSALKRVPLPYSLE